MFIFFFVSLECSRVSTCVTFVTFVFFFKQKTAYEMRISDWSSDVCSSDLAALGAVLGRAPFGGIDDAAREERRPAPREVHRSGQIGRASCRERVCQYV